ncbi:MAG TPA: Spy/CpxP family protein refolding chaperone [Candidatus Eisenbacteria bacterium]|nr:Spy/CpxP family protein refolding chaperone [Candidatus Eisenbacteria bacterium]
MNTRIAVVLAGTLALAAAPAHAAAIPAPSRPAAPAAQAAPAPAAFATPAPGDDDLTWLVGGLDALPGDDAPADVGPAPWAAGGPAMLDADGDDGGMAADLLQDDPPGGGPDGPAAPGPGDQRIVRRFMLNGGPGMGGPAARLRMRRAVLAMRFARLDLSDEQRSRLAAIRDRQQRKAIQARADLAIARLDLRALLRADNPQNAAIDAQIDHIARMRAELAKSRVAAMLEARSALTPEQRQQLRRPLRPRQGDGGAPGGHMDGGGDGKGSQ